MRFIRNPYYRSRMTSLVMTASWYAPRISRHWASSSAVLPLPTGPPPILRGSVRRGTGHAGPYGGGLRADSSSGSGRRDQSQAAHALGDAVGRTRGVAQANVLTVRLCWEKSASGTDLYPGPQRLTGELVRARPLGKPELQDESPLRHVLDPDPGTEFGQRPQRRTLTVSQRLPKLE